MKAPLKFNRITGIWTEECPKEGQPVICIDDSGELFMSRYKMALVDWDYTWYLKMINKKEELCFVNTWPSQNGRVIKNVIGWMEVGAHYLDSCPLLIKEVPRKSINP